MTRRWFLSIASMGLAGLGLAGCYLSTERVEWFCFGSVYDPAAGEWLASVYEE